MDMAKMKPVSFLVDIRFLIVDFVVSKRILEHVLGLERTSRGRSLA